MKHNVYRRILSALLAVVLLAGASPVAGLADSESTQTTVTEEFIITCDGQPVTELTISRNEKRVICADGLPEGCEYQWQICLTDSETWVDIYQEQESELTVSYPLVRSLLDGESTVALRCAALMTTEETVYTDPVTVTVDLSEFMPVQESSAQLSLTAARAGIGGDAVTLANADVTFITVIINYKKDVLGNGQYVQLCEPYVATIEKGTAHPIEEKNPVEPGYAPFYNGVQLGKTFEITLTSEQTQTSVELDIIYQRVPVHYEVRYFLQNLSNDQYTEDAGLHRDAEGLTGDQPDPEVINMYLEGYTALFYQPDAIAADGSTVFEVYYDRNYYLINFDQQGGYGTAPIYARYGTAFTPATPVRHGYVFDGWDLDKTETIQPVYETVTDANGDPVQVIKRDDVGDIVMETVTKKDLGDGNADTDFPSTIPAQDRTYNAVWIRSDTKYTISYWVQNANNDSYSYISSAVVDATSGDVVNLNDLSDAQKAFPLPDTQAAIDERYPDKLYEYVEIDTDAITAQYATHTLENGSIEDGVLVEGDESTTFNVYFKRKEYTLRFYYAAENTTDGTYKIVGGSTYYFGYSSNVYKDSAANRADEIMVLDQFITDHSSEWGTVSIDPANQKYAPQLNADGKTKGYTEGSETGVKGWKYHYISFQARYGADISKKWPVDVFDSVTRTGGNDSQSKWIGNTATVSAWNGEYYVYYSQHSSEHNNNETVKGKYEKLDYHLLFNIHDGINQSSTDSSTVSFLCFWENGADIWWSIPKLWRYEIYVKLLNDEIADSNVHVDYNGSYYKKIDYYDTCDDSDLWGQTAPALEGYTYEGRQSYVINDFDTNTYYEASAVRFFYSPQGSTNLIFKSTENKTMNDEDRDPNPDPDENEKRDGVYVPYNTELTETYFLDINANLNDLYPPNLEYGAYEFDGWYASPDFNPATKFWDKDGMYVGGENFNTKVVEQDGQNVRIPTMPAGNLTLYQKWTPKTYTVEFFWNYKDLVNNATARVRASVTATHNERLKGVTIDNPSYEVSSGEYMNPHFDPDEDVGLFSFAGWFYLDKNGKRVAFDPNEMVYTQELKLFAEWKTKITTSYTIRYLKAAMDGAGNPLKDANGNYYAATENGNVIELASPTTGFIFTGTTKTFTAKAGDDLVDEPNGGMWLPQTGSHSILMDRNPDNNVFDFLYVAKDSIGYTVEYRYAANNELIPELDQENDDSYGKTGQDYYTTKDAVISVLPQYLKDYTSSPPFATMVMSLDEGQNIVTFYYTLNTETDEGEGGSGGGGEIIQKNHYIVHYLLQDLDDPFSFTEQETASGTEEFGFRVEKSTFNGKTFTGFLYKDAFDVTVGDETKTFTSGFGSKDGEGNITVTGTDTSKEIGEEIVELWLFYQRNSYPYVVKYLESGTENAVSPQYEGTAKYSQTVSATAPEIYGYDLVSTSTQTKNIGVETGNYDELKRNVIKFYYQQKEVVINYTAVCQGGSPDMTGWLSRNVERPTDFTDAAGKIQGSLPQSIPAGYKFMGWYTDETCQTKVTSTWISDTKLTPKVETQVETGIYEFTYYALFKPITLTITQTGIEDSAVYQIVKADSTVLLTVVLSGESSVEVKAIPAGTYIVRALTNWTWTYTVTAAEPTADLTTDTAKTVRFSYAAKETDWLGGENYKDNNFN